MKKSILILTVIFMIWLIVHLTVTSIDGLSDHIQKTDIALVLGNKVNLDKSLSPRLKGRLDKVIDLYKMNMIHRIVVSGGIDKNNNNEAEIMRKYLIQNAVPRNLIWVDPNGKDTFHSVKNVVFLMQKENYESILIVSQFYHISRIKLILHKYKIIKIFSTHSTTFELRDIYSLFREFFGFYKYAFLKADSL